MLTCGRTTHKSFQISKIKMNEHDQEVVGCMESHGTVFEKQLAALARVAPPGDLALIKKTGPSVWALYAGMVSGDN